MFARAITVAGLAAASTVSAEETGRRFCAEGSFDLGHRFQGIDPETAEAVPTRWCVTSDGGEAILVEIAGKANSDVEGAFNTLYLPGIDKVIVGSPSAPEIAFPGAAIAAEAQRFSRIDPVRLGEELGAPDNGVKTIAADGHAPAVQVTFADGRPISAETVVDLPLRGRVPAVYRWNWPTGSAEPDRLSVTIDGLSMFEGKVTVEPAPVDFAAWAAQDDVPEAPGEAWPAQVGMVIEDIAPGVHRMRSARTGFHHLVVETSAGLVVADAPAGWVELSQIPPLDLVPGLGISGLSERFVDALHERFPDTPIRAVVLTHHHDDHVGGARAFAAQGATVYAPFETAPFLRAALSRDTMPHDRLAETGKRVEVVGVDRRVRLEDGEHPVEIIAMDGTPHAGQMLGIWLPNTKLFFQSDLHTASAEDPAPPVQRRLSECWTARWVRDNLPPGALILGSHTRQVSPREQLVAWLDSEVCAPR